MLLTGKGLVDRRDLVDRRAFTDKWGRDGVSLTTGVGGVHKLVTGGLGSEDGGVLLTCGVGGGGAGVFTNEMGVVDKGGGGDGHKLVTGGLGSEDGGMLFTRGREQ